MEKGTVEALIDVAKGQLGVKESPPNSNEVLYNDWYYGRHVSGPDYPWCMVFVQWCCWKAYVPLPMRTPSCGALMNAAKKTGQFVKKDYKPGDILLYSFTGIPWPTHTGIMISFDKSKNRYITIEGNTSNSNEANGGEVMQKERKLANIVGAVRPKFIYKEKEEEDLDISKLTDKEAYEILTKAMAYADKLPEPAWSIQNGSWKAAMDKKIITINTPQGLVRRDEVATILQRLGLL